MEADYPVASERFARGLTRHQEMVETLGRIAPEFETAVDLLATALATGHKILACGNGGSYSQSLHLCGEFTGKLRDDRPPLPAVPLGANAASLTAIGNDYGYESTFAREVVGTGRAGDVLVALSTSGRSRNVDLACRAAREKGIAVVALAGASQPAYADACDVVLGVGSHDTCTIQEGHLVLIHLLVECVEGKLLRRS